jgi:hypothetical protein
MTRAALATLDVRQQFLSVVSQKLTTESTWTVIGQGQAVSPGSGAAVSEHRRVGDENITKVPGVISHDVTVQIYVDSNLKEVARMLGIARPGGGWVGNEEIKLDPTKKMDFMIVNYNGTATSATPVFVEYINQFQPANFKPPLEAGTEARVAEVSGSAVAFYMMPIAGV